MKYCNLGNTNIKVSRICLGTMTYGEQNTEKEAHEQLDYAMAQGVNFIDTAELYSVPARPETYGLTEKYIGSWLKKEKKRDNVVIASKICGPGTKHIRGGSKFNKEHITNALEGSLSRLNTDYIDLYQLHWPERKANYFGQLGYMHKEDDLWEENFLEILEVLNEQMEKGKIRFIGISNETPWGFGRFIQLAEKYNLPRIVSVQNPYNLLNRTYEVGMAEISIREKTGLLAYSPLAFGLLTGKYYHGAKPEKVRLTLFGDRLKRYNGELAHRAADKYTELARNEGLKPSQLALAFVNEQPFLTSNIIGATTMEQLKEDIESINIRLSEEIKTKIEAIHLQFPNPAP